MKYKAIVIGVSAGGIEALIRLLSALSSNFPFPIIIVQHLHPDQGKFYISYFNELCALTVKEADEKEPIKAGTVYFAPPNYHLLVEVEQRLSLNVDEKVNYSRPSIDVLFETAAETYSSGLIGIVLTGANHDGALGLQCIKRNGGLVIVQDPLDAEVPIMPQAAIAATEVDYVLSLADIIQFLQHLTPTQP